jgi:hypothetical protein
MLPSFIDLTTTNSSNEGSAAQFAQQIAKVPTFDLPTLMAADFTRNADIMRGFDSVIQNADPSHHDYAIKRAIATGALLGDAYYSSLPVICSSAMIDACNIDGLNNRYRTEDNGRHFSFNRQYSTSSGITRYDFMTIQTDNPPAKCLFPVLHIDKQLLHTLDKYTLKQPFCAAMAQLVKAGHDYIHAAHISHYSNETLSRFPKASYQRAPLHFMRLSLSESARPETQIAEEPVVFTLNHLAHKALPRTSKRLDAIASSAQRVFDILDKLGSEPNPQTLNDCRKLVTMLVSNLVHREDLEKTSVQQWKHLLQTGTTTLHETVPFREETITPAAFSYKMFQCLAQDAAKMGRAGEVDELLARVEKLQKSRGTTAPQAL